MSEEGRASSDARWGGERRDVAPGVVHVPGWLDLPAQRELVAHCLRWAAEGPGARAARLPRGGVMSVETVCLGWHWIPYRYSRTRDDQDGSAVLPFPAWLGDLGRRAVADAYGDPGTARSYRPDVALVNRYRGDSRMGMHQDRDEVARDPVVSLSLGDACVFRVGNTEHRGRPWTDLVLGSGDLVVFGGENRLAYHGVPRVLAGELSPDIGLDAGRLNITLRVSGLVPTDC